jgi:osmotically-inducible protein OsmY
VEQSIKSKLASDPKMADTKIDVSADTDKNQVTLSGTVYSEAARTEALISPRTPNPASKWSTKSM